MDINQIQKPLTSFYQKVAETIKIDEMIVFGSYGNGTATKNSDVDMIVISDDFINIRSDKRFNLLDRACRNIVPDIQAWGITQKELNQASELSTLGQAKKYGVWI